MKIYVITKGEYEDYRICAVTEDKERAEKLKNVFEGEIEEYDTEKFLPIIEDGYKLFHCESYGKGNNVSARDETVDADCWIDKAIQATIIYYEPWKYNDYQYGYGMYVLAKTEEQAKEIFYQKLAEYKEKQRGKAE